MKDTPELREWVTSLVDKYYNQIGVNMLPKVYFKPDDMPHTFQCDHTVKQHKKFAGMSFRSLGKKPHVILLNIGYHRSYRELENTIAHEMMHIRFPHLNHNDNRESTHEDFFVRLGQVLQGKHFNKSPRKVKAKRK